MSTYEVGDGVTLQHSVYNGDGDLAAATVVLTVTRPDGTTFQPGVSSPSTGVYESEQIVADPAGLWGFVWSSTGTVVDNTPGAFLAVDPAAAGWATSGDVLAITGQAVTAAQVLQAQAVIEVYTGRAATLADEALTNRDRHWLKHAVCWQAAWLTEQATYHARSSFEFQIQDGSHLRLNGAHELQLAPLATRAIRNLSWMGNRALTLTVGGRTAPVAFTNEASDSTHGWEPL